MNIVSSICTYPGSSPAPTPPPPPPPSPTPSPSGGGKAGVAQHFEHDTASLGALASGTHVSWNYNWGMSSASVPGITFVPMVWGAASTSQLSALPDSQYLLGFNEPNMNGRGGSSMSVQQAVSLWPQVEAAASAHGVRTLVGPAMAHVNPTQWYDAFFASCHGCRVDAIALHSYNCDMPGLKSYVDSFRKYGKPLWLTELACADNPTAIPGNTAGSKSAEWQCKYIQELVPYLEGESIIEKYSWFSVSSSYSGESALVSGGRLTALGECYNSAIARAKAQSSVMV